MGLTWARSEKHLGLLFLQDPQGEDLLIVPKDRSNDCDIREMGTSTFRMIRTEHTTRFQLPFVELVLILNSVAHGAKMYRNMWRIGNMCWIKNVILEKTEVLFAMENNLYL